MAPCSGVQFLTAGDDGERGGLVDLHGNLNETSCHTINAAPVYTTHDLAGDPPHRESHVACRMSHGSNAKNTALCFATAVVAAPESLPFSPLLRRQDSRARARARVQHLHRESRSRRSHAQRHRRASSRRTRLHATASETSHLTLGTSMGARHLLGQWWCAKGFSHSC